MDITKNIQDLEKLKQDLQFKLRHVERAIESLKLLSDSGSSNLTELEIVDKDAADNIARDMYYRAVGTAKRILIILKNTGRFLHIRDFATEMFTLDESLSIEKYVQKLSPVLSRMRRDGILVKIGNSNLYTYWGLKEWLDEGGNVKPGYEPEEV